MKASLSASVQGVHLSKVFGCPLILMIPISGLHIDIDQLDDEATP